MGRKPAAAPRKAPSRPQVEKFGVHDLILKSGNKSKYKDVYPVRRKWQAKVWVAAKERHVHLGFFDSATEAAVEVAKARADGLENLPSPANGESRRLPCPLHLSSFPSYMLTRCLILMLVASSCRHR